MIVSMAFLVAVPPASGATLTLCLDGSLYETELRAVRGAAELTLPPGYRPDSLRVRPLDSSEVSRVDVSVVPPSAKTVAETARLRERAASLRDRLKALDAREEIFLSAAKSQSGKAPRRSKTNPEPIAAIRQGTDFALGKLEEVYRSRRLTEQELKDIESKLAAMIRESANSGGKASIRVSRGDGRIAVSYIRPDLRWTPVFDVRVMPDGSGSISLQASLPRVEKGVAVAVAPGSLSGYSPGGAVKANGQQVLLARYPFTASRVEFEQNPPSRLSLSVRLPAHIPAGEASCYWNGEYLGRVPFAGGKEGETLLLSCGRE